MSDKCTVGFYSQAELPVALRVCQESRNVVKGLYPRCFGWFLQPERILFNFNLDTLYLPVSPAEEELRRLFGVLKASELNHIQSIAIHEKNFTASSADPYQAIVGLNRVLRAMPHLKEITIVFDITTEESNPHSSQTAQIKFYASHEAGNAQEGWPAVVEELPNTEEKFAWWKPSRNTKLTAVYGWRPISSAQ